MFHPFAGFSGASTVILVSASIWAVSFNLRKKIAAYDIDPRGRPGAFEPLLQKYFSLAEFIIGLGTGSIVLLVGSSAFHGQNGHLPWFYASPLLILSGSVLFGLSFMAWLILSYEEAQHGNPHTPFAYSLSERLGFSSSISLLYWLCVAYYRGHSLRIAAPEKGDRHERRGVVQIPGKDGRARTRVL